MTCFSRILLQVMKDGSFMTIFNTKSKDEYQQPTPKAILPKEEK